MGDWDSLTCWKVGLSKRSAMESGRVCCCFRATSKGNLVFPVSSLPVHRIGRKRGSRIPVRAKFVILFVIQRCPLFLTVLTTPSERQRHVLDVWTLSNIQGSSSGQGGVPPSLCRYYHRQTLCIVRFGLGRRHIFERKKDHFSKVQSSCGYVNYTPSSACASVFSPTFPLDEPAD